MGVKIDIGADMLEFDQAATGDLLDQHTTGSA